MKVIGILGGIGAGKTTVTRLMSELCPMEVILADLVGHDVLLKGHPAYEPVVLAFGTDILDDNDEIVRKKLGEKVFGHPEELAKLNSITHPIIYNEIKEQIAYLKKTTPKRHILLEAALLIEGGLIDLVDLVVGVYAEDPVRIERVMQREGLNREQIIKRFKAQKKWEELKSIADEIIDNSISLEYTKKQVEEILARL